MCWSRLRPTEAEPPTNKKKGTRGTRVVGVAVPDFGLQTPTKKREQDIANGMRVLIFLITMADEAKIERSDTYANWHSVTGIRSSDELIYNERMDREDRRV
ncbi:hypothetical protein V1478_012452 [Vespula squamosa]|uniref:Uncharacterized protein n=1 Tax=Vespula squamosa TaxID=30214 RepID=A0ABD2ADA2_VESSQ